MERCACVVKLLEIVDLRLEIRESRPDDWPAMVALGGDEMPASPSIQADFADHPLIQSSRVPGAISLVAEEGTKLVGVLVCGGGATPSHVHHLRVDQAYEDQGVGRALIDKLLFKIRSRGIHTLQLPAHLQDACRFLDLAKWEGQRDLKGEIPIGRNPACSLV